MKYAFLFLLLGLVAFSTKAQSVFLSNAKAEGLANSIYALKSSESLISLENPALLDSSSSKSLGLTFGTIARTNAIVLAYQFSTKREGQILIFGRSTGYGKFIETNEIGEEIGQFSANSFQLGSVFSKEIGPFSLGVSLLSESQNKTLQTDFSFLSNLGVYYVFPNQTVKMGLSINDFLWYKTIYFVERPLSINYGFTIKPVHAPLNFYFSFINLNRWNDSVFDHLNTGQKLASHLSLGIEILATKNVSILMGNNFKQAYYFSNESPFALSGGLALNFNNYNLSMSLSNNKSQNLLFSTSFSYRINK